MKHTFFTKSLIKTSLVLGALCLVQGAWANTAQLTNLVTFSVNVEDEVMNDEATARLSKTLQAKTAKEFATQINPIITKAIATAKKYPTVQVSTGSQHAYPRYDKSGKIIGFTGSASINLKSTNTEDLATLIGELQNTLVLDDLSFGVSKALQDRSKSDLKTKASTQFQQEARELVSLWRAKDYRIIELKMDTDSSYRPRYAMDAMSFKAVAAESASAPSLEVGTSQINYRINGTIQLVY